MIETSLALMLWMLPPAAPAPAAAPQEPEIPADTEIVTTESGLKYSVLQPGDGGSRPKMGERVKVHYTGWLPDGTLFDSSVVRGEPSEFQLGQVIQGWNEALQLMSRGSRFKLTIPPELGYGARGSGPTIPPNATLIFEVQLLDFTSLPDMPPANPEAQKKTESGILYEVLAEGEGDKVADGDFVSMKFALWNTSGKLIDCTEKQGLTLDGSCGKMPFEVLNQAARLMAVGGRIRMEAPPELVFGARARGPDLPANSVTVWVLEVQKITKPLPVPEFSELKPGRTLRTNSGLKYEVLREGSGDAPKLGDQVTVHYAGWLTDGKNFDSSFSRGDPSSFFLGRVIQGWNEGLQLMKPGAIYKFHIPAALGYGQRGQGQDIPPNADLIFYVELIGVKTTAQR